MDIRTTGHTLRNLWIALGLVVALSFGLLLYYGGEIYQMAPPIPERIVTTAGNLVFTGDEILAGQDVWRSIGGQELGSIWGHGAYTAPDWTADWLHREALYLLDAWAHTEAGVPYDRLDSERQAVLRARLQADMRTNTFDEAAGAIVLSEDRARAIQAVQNHYTDLFGDAPDLADLRESYAMPANTLPNEREREQLTAFVFWASWVSVTERPDRDFTYTSNWPPDELLGNTPPGHLIVVSVLSFVLLLGGVGALAWFYAATRESWASTRTAKPRDPLITGQATPSMYATVKYFWVVGLLLVLQMVAGVVTAHYGVEGTALYGVPIAQWLPYSLTRTWHVQLGMFWIATAWLATGLCLAPMLTGHEPRYQRLGVNVLFGALLLVVGGSLTGQALAIHRQLSPDANFWVGHQGFEYLDLGRLWQLLLFGGLLFWMVLMLRCLVPGIRRSEGVNRQILVIFGLAVAAIALFYGAGLMAGRDMNLAIAEYWRWWVVHLWVEGFFEVFAVAVVAFAFIRLGLVQVRSATMAVLFTTILYLAGGVLGTFHHLYFTGTAPAIIALGGTFSALELVPLVMIGFEGYENWTLHRSASWAKHYKWPIFFLVAVAFWNLVGAGLFGFLINPPIALYYMQGLNTTPVHAHAALFGVYGMLGLGLMLLSLRILTVRRQWRTGALAFSFWAMQIGLGLMILLSLLPIGLAQTWASVEHGMWYARSAEFLQQEPWQTFRWLRAIGDTIFAAGMLAMGWFVVGLSTGWSLGGTRGESTDAPAASDRPTNAGTGR